MADLLLEELVDLAFELGEVIAHGFRDVDEEVDLFLAHQTEHLAASLLQPVDPDRSDVKMVRIGSWQWG